MCTINSVHALRDITSSRLNEAAHAIEAMAGFQLSQRSGRNAKSQEESQDESEAQEESEGQSESEEGSEGKSEAQSSQESQEIARLLDIVLESATERERHQPFPLYFSVDNAGTSVIMHSSRMHRRKQRFGVTAKPHSHRTIPKRGTPWREKPPIKYS
jgi:hypothetical protein